MKYIYFSRGIYHMINDDHAVLCNPCFGMRTQDIITDSPSVGKLCKACKKKYLKYHTEADLMLELL